MGLINLIDKLFSRQTLYHEHEANECEYIQGNRCLCRTSEVLVINRSAASYRGSACLPILYVADNHTTGTSGRWFGFAFADVRRPSQSEWFKYLRTVWHRITKFYTDIHANLLNSPTRYGVTSCFRSAVIKITKSVEKVDSDGFGSNFSGAVICLAQPIGGLLVFALAPRASSIYFSLQPFDLGLTYIDTTEPFCTV